MEDEFVNTTVAAALMGVTRATLRKYCLAGAIEYRRFEIGDRPRYKISLKSLLAFLERSTVKERTSIIDAGDIFKAKKGPRKSWGRGEK